MNKRVYKELNITPYMWDAMKNKEPMAYFPDNDQLLVGEDEVDEFLQIHGYTHDFPVYMFHYTHTTGKNKIPIYAVDAINMNTIMTLLIPYEVVMDDTRHMEYWEEQ